eukprot:TRINITY_DN4676_c1_g1_i1.p1 TRINITY_DN4676_c1_g1~~TRINITY_DN4676_c1_g1_i1.p1  ORF type:complete len:277 (+),score=63.15 TRINITY_DN4676_c1_g1_i1:106-936(+)
MLLRSASTPILNSWVPQSMELSPEPDLISTVPKNRSPLISLKASLNSSPSTSSKMPRARSESDLRRKQLTVRSPNDLSPISSEEDEEDDEEERLFSSSGLNECCSVLGLNDKALVLGGDFGGICGGGGGGGGSNGGGFGCSDSYNNNGSGSADAYYKTMIEANPGNPLFLGNYARYLKEVRGDLIKAEEYCGRAILQNPGDADVLSMYADLIWENHKDASRAESYFDRAMQAAPDDCYVLGSYASFLWDAEEEENEEASGLTAAPSSYKEQPILIL